MKKMVRRRSNAVVFLISILIGITQGQDVRWTPSKGDAALNLWSGTSPGEPPTSAAEGDLTKPDAKLVAGKRVTIYGNVSVPTLTVFQPRTARTGMAVAVFPGGGYNVLAIDLEGTEVCDWLVSKGITCVLVKYRVPRTGPYPGKSPAALQDAQRAVRLIRAHAVEWHVDAKRIGVLGFSAGGHLAAALSMFFETNTYPRVDAIDDLSCRPDFTVLIYPAYLSASGEQFAPSPDLKVSAQTPPAFIVQTEDDPVHVESAIAYFMALKRQKIPAEMHLYAQGGHGYGLRHTQLPVTDWPQLVERWFTTIGMVPGKQ